MHFDTCEYLQKIRTTLVAQSSYVVLLIVLSDNYDNRYSFAEIL